MARFDNVRIKCTLCQETGTGNLVSLGLKRLDELGADDFSLLLRVGNACQTF